MSLTRSVTHWAQGLTALGRGRRRAPEARDAAREETQPLLRQYARPRPKRLWIAIAVLTAIACAAYGFGFAIMAPARMVQFGFPLLILLALCLWALPELGRAPTRPMEVLFFAFFISLPMWPNYLAIALPGLPWITILRIIGFPLAFLLLLSLSISQRFRDELWKSLNGTPALWKFLAAFAILQAFSVLMSNAPQTSLNKLLVAQVNWICMYFIAVYVFIKPKRAETWTLVLCIMSVAMCFIAMREFQNGRVLWAGHIPSFLAVDDPSVQKTLTGSIRAGTDRYRAQGTFATALGLGEFLALTTPFFLHYLLGPYRLATRLFGLVGLPLVLISVILTDTRLSVVGYIMSIVLYMLFWGLQRWRETKGSLIGPAVVISYPATMLLVMASVLFVPRIRVMTLGGGRHQSSTDARVEQVTQGLPMVIRRPLGHGIGRGAEALGFTNADGVMTIDTYYLLVALDYGLPGFVLFFGMLLLAIFNGGFGVLRGVQDREQRLLVPLSISLTVYFVIKSIYAGVENQAIIFMMLGAVTALVARQKAGQAVAESSKPL